MSRNKPIFLLTMIISLSLLQSCLKNEVSVVIKNNSDNVIQEIDLEYTGGKSELGRLQKNAEVEQKIHPTGESSLTIFYTSGKKQYKEDLDVYLEPRYKGKILVTIGDDGQIKHETNIRVR